MAVGVLMLYAESDGDGQCLKRNGSAGPRGVGMGVRGVRCEARVLDS
jgi:hypothetical protein